MGKITSACRNVIAKKEEKSNDVIKTARKYIDDNFAKDISLDDVSRRVNISPYYFSKIFKDELKFTIVSDATEMRM